MPKTIVFEKASLRTLCLFRRIAVTEIFSMGQNLKGLPKHDDFIFQ